MSAATSRQASRRELTRATEAILSSLRQQLFSAKREATTIAAAGLINDRAVSAERRKTSALDASSRRNLAATFGDNFAPGFFPFDSGTTGPLAFTVLHGGGYDRYTIHPSPSRSAVYPCSPNGSSRIQVNLVTERDQARVIAYSPRTSRTQR